MNDKRQKVMLGVIAVLALGAGGYYFVFSGNDVAVVQENQNTSVRKKRVVKENVRAEKKKRVTESEEPERVERREREQSERNTSRKKRGTRGGPKKVTKRKFAPAA